MHNARDGTSCQGFLNGISKLEPERVDVRVPSNQLFLLTSYEILPQWRINFRLRCDARRWSWRVVVTGACSQLPNTLRLGSSKRSRIYLYVNSSFPFSVKAE